MSELGKAVSVARSGEGKNDSSITVALAGLAMLTLWLGTPRDSIARRDPETRAADLMISVRVYNYGGSSASSLRLAESETDGIFARAGICLEWHECIITAHAESADPTCDTPVTPTDLRLRIVKSVNLKPTHASTENIGFTIGSMATVQLDPLQKFVRPTGTLRYQMLARAIAHEFGHALLGPEHSSQGIMRACWGVEQWEWSASNEMVFTPDQEKALRLAVKARNRQ